jgi:hypothetical protein
MIPRGMSATARRGADRHRIATSECSGDSEDISGFIVEWLGGYERLYTAKAEAGRRFLLGEIDVAQLKVALAGRALEEPASINCGCVPRDCGIRSASPQWNRAAAHGGTETTVALGDRLDLLHPWWLFGRVAEGTWNSGSRRCSQAHDTASDETLGAQRHGAALAAVGRWRWASAGSRPRQPRCSFDLHTRNGQTHRVFYIRLAAATSTGCHASSGTARSARRSCICAQWASSIYARGMRGSRRSVTSGCSDDPVRLADGREN